MDRADKNNKWQVDLHTSRTIHTIYLGNRSFKDEKVCHLGHVNVWLKSDVNEATSSANQIYDGIHDSGFFPATQLISGRVVTFQRMGSLITST